MILNTKYILNNSILKRQLINVEYLYCEKTVVSYEVEQMYKTYATYFSTTVLFLTNC